MVIKAYFNTFKGSPPQEEDGKHLIKWHPEYKTARAGSACPCRFAVGPLRMLLEAILYVLRRVGRLLCCAAPLRHSVFASRTNKLMIDADSKKRRRPLPDKQRHLLLAGNLQDGRRQDRDDTGCVPELTGDRIERLEDRVLRVSLILHGSTPCTHSQRLCHDPVVMARQGEGAWSMP